MMMMMGNSSAQESLKRPVKERNARVFGPLAPIVAIYLMFILSITKKYSVLKLVNT